MTSLDVHQMSMEKVPYCAHAYYCYYGLNFKKHTKTFCVKLIENEIEILTKNITKGQKSWLQMKDCMASYLLRAYLASLLRYWRTEFFLLYHGNIFSQCEAKFTHYLSNQFS